MKTIIQLELRSEHFHGYNMNLCCHLYGPKLDVHEAVSSAIVHQWNDFLLKQDQ